MSEKRKDSNGRILRTGESQRKDGRYQYRYMCNGKRLVIYASSLKELREKVDDLKISKQQRENYVKGQITVFDMCKKFYETKHNLRKTTQSSYQNKLHNLKRYSFSQMKIREVTTTDVKQWCIEQTEDYKFATIKNHLSMVRQAFQAACMDDILLKNPCMFSLSSIIAENSSNKYSLNDKEIEMFLNGLQPSSYYYNLALVLLHTGLRIGECLALTIQDIDFEQRVLHIDKQVVLIYGKKHISTTKTSAGIRIVPMDDVVFEVLQQTIQDHSPTKYTLDGVTNFVFHFRGRLLAPENVRYHFHTCVDRYNATRTEDMIQLPHITPHILRHTFCSKLAQSGINPKALQYIMGHASVEVTMGTYTHISPTWALQEFAQINTPLLTPKLQKSM